MKLKTKNEIEIEILQAQLKEFHKKFIKLGREKDAIKEEIARIENIIHELRDVEQK